MGLEMTPAVNHLSGLRQELMNRTQARGTMTIKQSRTLEFWKVSLILLIFLYN